MNYLGNKTKLNDWIYASIKDFICEYEDFSIEMIFADLFSGTGSVGKYWSAKGHEVIANDIQYYSFAKINSLLKNKQVRKTKIEEILGRWNKINASKLSAGFITKNYSPFNKQTRMFLTIENAKIIDFVINDIKKIHSSKLINTQEKYYLISELIDAASRVSNTAVVYEAYLKKFKNSSIKKINFRNKITDEQTKTKAKVYNGDVNELVKKIKGDILYLDPPYNSRGYDSNYHLLETIAIGDNPKIRNVSGRRDEDAKKSDYTLKSSAFSAMKNLLENSKFRYIFVSYNNEGIITREQMKNLINSKKWTFRVYKKKYPRFKSNKNNGPRYVEEILYAIKKEE